MTSEISVNGNRQTSITHTETQTECLMPGNEPLGTDTNQLMYLDTDLFWSGLKPIRVTPQKMQWIKCYNNIHVVKCRCINYKCNHNKEGCGCVFRTPTKATSNKSSREYMIGMIPYPTTKATNVIAKAIKAVQPMNRDMNIMPLMKRTDEIGRLIESATNSIPGKKEKERERQKKIYYSMSSRTKGLFLKSKRDRYQTDKSKAVKSNEGVIE